MLNSPLPFLPFVALRGSRQLDKDLSVYRLNRVVVAMSERLPHVAG